MVTQQQLEALYNERPYKQAGNRDSYSDYAQGWADAISRVEELLNAAQQKHTADMGEFLKQLRSIQNHAGGIDWNND